jgi:circadian clock protein KaiC
VVGFQLVRRRLRVALQNDLCANRNRSTILSTVEVDESFTEFPFSTYSISFLCDDIIRLRYVSIDAQLRKIMMVIKMRGGNHAKDIRGYEITPNGVVILDGRLENYRGLISGLPVYTDRSKKNE